MVMTLRHVRNYMPQLRSCGLTFTQAARLLRQTRRLGVCGGRKPVTLLRAESQVRSLVAREISRHDVARAVRT
jgi:hypothetical protein